jgi:EAL and modified HD-GYP domain-containing signal transduction protein
MTNHSPTIAYQILFNNQREAIGYELFNHSVPKGEHTASTDRELLFALLSNPISETGRASGLIFINMTHASLKEEAITLLEPDLIVFEVCGVTGDDRETIEAVYKDMQILRRRRFRFACDQTVLRAPYELWKNIASFVKVAANDMSTQDFTRIAKAVQKQTGAMFIAQCVETQDHFDLAEELGAKYFQGFYFSQLVDMRAQVLSTTKLELAKLIQMLQTGASVESVEEFVKRIPNLMINFLRAVNSAGLGGNQEVRTFAQAAAILGPKKMLRWALLCMTRAIDTEEQGSNRVSAAVLRGRVMELLVRDALGNAMGEAAFLTGVISSTNVGDDIDAALKGMNLPSEAIEALVHGEGPLAPFLAAAIASEAHAEGLPLQVSSIDQETINAAQLQALSWLQSVHI